MSQFIAPLKNPKPDIARFLAAMDGTKIPERAPMCEYLIDNALMQPILENMLGRQWVDTSDKTEYMGGQMEFSRENQKVIDAWLDNQIAFWYHMGYDYVRVEASLSLPAVALVTSDTAHGNESHNRAWQGLGEGPIKTWEDFEKYPWPKVTDGAFYIHEYICKHLPEGLGFISCHAGGVYEHVSRLMGYTGMCMCLHDDPALVQAVADRLGELIFQYNERLLQMEGLAAVFQGEDFGFNTQLLIAPGDIRKYFLPWHKRFAKQAHDGGRRYYLHSCGKVDGIMEDLIEDVKIDGKHSYQDNVLPVGEYKKRWGSRIALLGGLDIHKVSTYTPEELRKYVRQTIDECSPDGRFAIGSGNSITSYVPMENYMTIVDEALR